jgi:hypothetical protein
MCNAAASQAFAARALSMKELEGGVAMKREWIKEAAEVCVVCFVAADALFIDTCVGSRVECVGTPGAARQAV